MTDRPLTICAVCGSAATFLHDHKPDNSGLDDGPPIWRSRKMRSPKIATAPAQIVDHAPRKKAAPKSAVEMRDIRAAAWATRRAKYGQHGHR